jgi:enoyl-CoA hydratase/carnithine racemase
VQKVVEPEQLMDETLRLAKLSVAKGPNAVKKVKRVTRSSRHLSFIEGCELEDQEFGSLFGEGSEGEEGMRAFLEKRKPNW